jgi:hypothetical protein
LQKFNGKFFASFLLILLVSGCGLVQIAQNSAQRQKDEAQLNQAVSQFGSCLQSSPVGKKSDCAYSFYQFISAWNNNDFEKPAAMIFVRKIYELLVKIDRGQITNQQDANVATMRIESEFQSNLQNARINAANANAAAISANAAAAAQQQQMFLNAYRLLSIPSGNGGMNCYHPPGSPYTSCY